MSVIKLTPELLIEGANKLINAKANNENAINNLTAIVDGLINDWHGEAQDAFAASYARKKATFKTFTLDIEQLAFALKNFAQTMQYEEKRAARMINGGTPRPVLC